jgi:hypothetical protein
MYGANHECGGVPFGNPQSFVRGNGTLYFYDTFLSRSMRDIEKGSAEVALSLTAAQVPGACAGENPDDPHCLRVVVRGVYDPNLSDEEEAFASKEMWRRHPEMSSWNALVPNHTFRFWAMRVEDVWATGGDDARTYHMHGLVMGPNECIHDPVTIQSYGFRA